MTGGPQTKRLERGYLQRGVTDTSDWLEASEARVPDVQCVPEGQRMRGLLSSKLQTTFP